MLPCRPAIEEETNRLQSTQSYPQPAIYAKCNTEQQKNKLSKESKKRKKGKQKGRKTEET